MGLYLCTGTPYRNIRTGSQSSNKKNATPTICPSHIPQFPNSGYFSAHPIFPTRKEAAPSPPPPFSIRKTAPKPPLSRGEYHHSSPSFSKRKQHPNLPSREGRFGCVTPAHSFLKSKASTRSQETPPHQTVAKSSHPMPHPSP